MTIDLVHMGVGQRHERSFVWDRAEGLGLWSFLHLRCPTDILTADGRRLAEPGTCILIDTTFPNWHGGHGCPLFNDWLWVDAPALEGRAQAMGLPINRCFHPQQSHLITRRMQEILDEHRQRLPLWRERVAQLIDGLLLEMGRSLLLLDAADPHAARRLGELRKHMITHLHDDWDMQQLAERIGLSANRFGQLYRATFGCSPIEDLLRHRIEQACLLLGREGRSVGETARACGFRDLPWFSRCFRQRVGCPPSRYRNRRPPQAGGA